MMRKGVCIGRLFTATITFCSQDTYFPLEKTKKENRLKKHEERVQPLKKR